MEKNKDDVGNFETHEKLPLLKPYDFTVLSNVFFHA